MDYKTNLIWTFIAFNQLSVIAFHLNRLFLFNGGIVTSDRDKSTPETFHIAKVQRGLEPHHFYSRDLKSLDNEESKIY